MQQVESKHRFWWRAAQDAPTPEPEAAQSVPPSREATPTTRGRSAAVTVSKRVTMKLQIPRGERRSRRTRRGRRWVIPSAIALLAVVAGGAAYVLPLSKIAAFDFADKADSLMVAAGFGIDQVNLSGQHFTSDSDVYDALDLSNVKTFAAFDSDAAMKRIERIPWVDTVQLTRIYPGTLDIVIHERAPAFVWTRGDTNYLVDATGRTLGPIPTAGTWKLPRVAGDGADTEAMLMLSAVRLVPKIERQYAYGERVAERRWRIFLKNGTALDLAADREIEGLREIANTPAVQAALTGARMIVDVRTPGRIAIRPATPGDRTASLRSSGTTAVASAQQ
ncbi:MAG: FtsQ-type POTRA domain-containing protein [Proteobacteria bacterium]|nr:FtsQ-type POTRA domain-containing protein [Pseudomonadota bacterium]